MKNQGKSDDGVETSAPEKKQSLIDGIASI